ncbi:ubiquitin carboxyl-terminal hydrolase 16-like [Gigantopelta aegis]|uniref:ubiquitin carboxyl-terminal hydrolase 16-like n=1 Tax=Gigantopelta aegis TaxID=1735272 RepID=UPI001B88B539|nr:ubiquitin carboxyl-terminal hydrolase 16-like [Gigantopelta aegis]
MRVLEVDTPPTYKMGKNKKHKKQRKGKDASDTSEDGATGSSGCTHLPKAVVPSVIKKACLKTSIGECSSCANDVSGKPSSREGTLVEGATAADVEESEVTVWMCLQCGHQGCDRNSKEMHALKHYETPHSTLHCIALNISLWTAWCYQCDSDIPIETSKRIQECVDVLRKNIGLPKIDLTPSGRSRRVESATTNEPQTVVKDKARPLTPRPTGTPTSCQKVKGLSNLGNTCFFNAVMQNLSQTHSLESLLVDHCKKGMMLTLPGHPQPPDSDSSTSSDDDNDEEAHKYLPSIDIVPQEHGPLMQTLLSFLQEMTNSSARGSTVNPSSLFGQVCKKAPRFKGYQQQDSHELLRYLLDAIRMEEIKRRQAGILKYFKIAEIANHKKLDEEIKLKVKDYGRQARHTFLDSLFGGQLISTIMCEECKQISQIFEPFLDLSLPVTEEKPERPNKVLGGKRKESADTEEHVLKGVDGFAARPDKPSKYAEKKNKKLARKSKRKCSVSYQKSAKSLAKLSNEIDGDGISSQKKDAKDKENEDQQYTDNEDPSDADVEDNLESDTSRLQQGVTDSDVAFAENGKNTPLLNSIETSTTITPSESSEQVCNSSIETFHTVNRDSLNQQQERVSNEPGIEAHAESYVDTNGCVDDLTLATRELKLTESDRIGEDSKPKENGCVNSADCDIIEMTNLSTEQCVKLMNSEHQNSCRLHDATDPGVDASLKRQQLNSSAASVDVGSESSNLRCVNSSEIARNDNCCDMKHSVKSDNDHVIDGLVSQAEAPGCNMSSGRQPSKQQKSRRELKQQGQYKSLSTLCPRYHPSSKECSIMSCLHQFTAPELLTGSNKFGCKTCTRLQKNKHSANKDKKTEMVYSNASKQFLVFLPPAVLTLHLKRFEQVGYNSRKVNRHVDFPFLLDLGPYCSSLCQGVRPGQKKVTYSLYGVVEHSGRLSGGHYTAYVKIRPSLSTVTDFLNTQLPRPMDYIHHYTEQVLNDANVPDDDVSDDFLESIVPPGKWYHISDSNVREVNESTVQRAQAYLLFYERIY